MGANIGTTMTAQLIAFKLSDIAPFILFLGMIMTIFIKKRLLARIGYIILGFGILFVGLGLMSQAMVPLQSNESFRSFLVNFKNPIIGVLVGALFTAVIQSSSASIGIVQALAMLGLIGLDSAVYVILGQNIGTCITAVLAAIGTSINSKRTAGIHLLFNILGTLIFLIILIPFPIIIDWVESLSGGNISRQIANFHTIFNVTVTILLFPFAKQMIKLISIILPEKYDPDMIERKLKYLNDRFAHNSSMILTLTLKEIKRLGEIVNENLKLSIESFFEVSEKKTEKVLETEITVDFLSDEIIKCLIDFGGEDLPEHDLKILGSLHHVIIDLERISDHAENIAEYCMTLSEKKIQMSPEGIEELRSMCEGVINVMNTSLDIFNNRDLQLLEMFNPLEEDVDRMEETFVNNHIKRLHGKSCDPQAGVIFTNMISDLERVADHATNIAYSIQS
jgi:phosphate:Na+ symporter